MNNLAHHLMGLVTGGSVVYVVLQQQQREHPCNTWLREFTNVAEKVLGAKTGRVDPSAPNQSDPKATQVMLALDKAHITHHFWGGMTVNFDDGSNIFFDRDGPIKPWNNLLSGNNK